jgi:YcaO-like protein with predicted kinase domain
MPAAANAIVHRAGTFRAATPESTWARVAPLLSTMDITRVADITGLDEIGLPVHVCYRPVGTTLAVSIGTGLSPAQSRVSAVMESIESWHVENPRLEIAVRSPARGLPLRYDIRQLNLAERSPLTDAVRLDWVAGRGLLSGSTFLVPADTIRLDFTAARSWATALFRPSTNGVATGNTPTEATLHALLELVERDCVVDWAASPPQQRRYVDPASAAHPDTQAILAALRRADCQAQVCVMTNAIGIPSFAARVWSADFPVPCGGFGCHLDPAIAVGRALLEAAQSRLCAISGARDDIDEDAYRNKDPKSPLPDVGPLATVSGPAWPGQGLDEAVAYCAEQVAATTGVEPFVVDLTRPDIGVAVSKVFAPGLRLDDRAFQGRPNG